MRIKAGHRLSVDTNILLDATDEGRTGHAQARWIFETFPGAQIELILGTQVLREYLVVVTRPEASNGLGLGLKDALENLEQFERRATIIAESREASRVFRTWVAELGAAGRKLHDLQILATTYAAGVSRFVTANTADFPSDRGVQIIHPSQLEIG